MKQQMEGNEIEIDLLELFYLLKEKLFFLIISACVCAVAAFTYVIFVIQPLYSSTSQLYILTKSTSLTSLADIQVGTQLTQDYLELIKSRPVVEEVMENLKMDSAYEEVLKQLTVDNPTNTRILKITARAEEPKTAKAIADEFAEVSRKQISQIMCTDEPSVVAYGYASDVPVNVHILKSTVIGALFGILIAAAAVVGLYLLNDTIQSSEDVEKYLGLNTLAAVPLQEGGKKKKSSWIKKKFAGHQRGKNNGKK